MLRESTIRILDKVDKDEWKTLPCSKIARKYYIGEKAVRIYKKHYLQIDANKKIVLK